MADLMYEVGAVAYVAKDDGPQTVVDAVRAAAQITRFGAQAIGA